MRRHLTFANVAAALALFFSLAGGAYAAVKVDGGDVKNESLTGKDLLNGSIDLKDVDGLGAKVTVRPGTPDSGTLFAGSSASCKSGETLISGGYTVSGNTPVFPTADAPGNQNTWFASVVDADNNPGAEFTVTAVALCAS